MNHAYFEDQITLSPAFKLWDRGDGIGEISLFNTIIGYIHGEKQLSDGYHYDEELEQYVEDNEVEFVPVSCFPGHLSSGHDLFQPFCNTYIDCIEHLISLVESLPSDFLPEKPKGSLIDVFSGQEKFLVSRDFDMDIVRYGKEIDKNILDNFNSFSQYIKNSLQQFPEIDIVFLSHSYINGNIYVQYMLADTYFLSVVFNKENTLLVGKINKSGKFNNFYSIDCNDSNYQTICESIFSALNLSLDSAKINLVLSKDFIDYIPKQKNLFFNEILHTHTQEFLITLSNRGKILLERDLHMKEYMSIEANFQRNNLLALQEKLSTYDIGVIDGLSLIINNFLHTRNNRD